MHTQSRQQTRNTTSLKKVADDSKRVLYSNSNEMVEIFERYNGSIARVIVGTKEQCTQSLSVYPNFLATQEVGFGIWKYYYKANVEEQDVFYKIREEHVG